MALLDSWATVGDVITFYQERIANELFLSTAKERRSVLELARLIGYELKPGLAASVLLAFRLDEPPPLIPQPEIQEAVRTLRTAGASEIVLLKCTSGYPAHPAEMNSRQAAQSASSVRQPAHQPIALTSDARSCGVSLPWQSQRNERS